MARSLEDAAHEEVQIAASAVHHILKDALFNKQPSIDAAVTTQAVAKVKFAALEVMTEDDDNKIDSSSTEDPIEAALRSLQNCTAGGPERLRESIQKTYLALSEMHRSLELQLREAPFGRRTSRRAFLMTLSDLIGQLPTDRTWKEEWSNLAQEIMDTVGWNGVTVDSAAAFPPSTPSTLKRSSGSQGSLIHRSGTLALSRGLTPEALIKLKSHQLEAMIAYGWSRDAAETFVVLSAASLPIAQALRERSPRFAAATYTICRQLYSRCRVQTYNHAVPQMLYCHLHGDASLTAEDDGWHHLLQPDDTGFQGLTSVALVTATDIGQNFTPEGFAIRLRDGLRIFYEVGTNTTPYLPIDSPVVGFESADADATGAHAAVMTAPHSGTFPPNCLFRLKRVVPKEEGFIHAPTGVRVMQQLLVVSATYLPPAEERSASASENSKFTTATLNYASREAYVKGLEGVEAPTLTMEMEFDREMEWHDWCGKLHSLRAEWAYCNGPASFMEGCTPGIRDATNDGMLPTQFMERTNAHIKKRRAMGLGLSHPESHAYLSLDEVVAVRLYSGPSFQPINAFLRQIANLKGSHRLAITRHAELTFSATVAHLCAAIRKLAAVTTREEASRPLYRGVRGDLPRNFWVVDEQGMVSATDVAFMSTTLDEEVAIEYMGSAGANLLWELQPQIESDAAYHRGADISMLSQFSHESECLFPPFTMLTVVHGPEELPRQPKELRDCLTEKCVSHDGKEYRKVRVLPSFV